VVTEAGFEVRHVEYSELFAFPASGGYVGPVLAPARPRWVGSALLGLDAGMLAAIGAVGLARFVAWRYLLVADLPG